MINKYRYLETNASLLESLKKNSLFENLKSSFKINTENENSIDLSRIVDERVANESEDNEESVLTEASSSMKKRKQRKKAIDWTEKETLNLVYLVEKVGRAWNEISTNYKEFFQERKAKDLINKYDHLEKTNGKLTELKEQARAIMSKESGSKVLIPVEKQKYIRWNDLEKVLKSF